MPVTHIAGCTRLLSLLSLAVRTPAGPFLLPFLGGECMIVGRGVGRLAGAPTLRGTLTIVGFCPLVLLFCDQKRSRKVPLLRGSGPRLRGCSPLRTPIMWSENAKAKKCRSAAFFLTPLRPLPIDPSGAKIFLVRRGGFYIRPVFFSVALNCTDEQCSPLQRV